MPGSPVDGFEEWYASVYSPLVGALTVVLRDPARAADCAAEACARAYERWDRVSEMDSPSGWTYRVALNVARRQLRREGLERRIRPRLFTPSSSVAPEPVSPEVWAAVATLTRRQRDVVALRIVLDLSQDEAARILGVRPGTIAATLATARRRLRHELDDFDDDEEGLT
jgi:RNA polymerase sigma factor (sigma-70 family)